MPKHALDNLNKNLFLHILKQNKEAKFSLVDWSGLGKNKEKVFNLIKTTDLEMIKV